jgi:tRNA 2-thiocytidine biosynthesis protein TtcA
LGHHADDAAQTALLNLFHQGRLESMPVRRLFFDGLLTLIRPLLEVDEKDIVDLARVAGFPISQEDCPYAEKSQRAAMARVLREIEQSAPWAKAKLQQAERKYAVQISLKDRPTLSV